MPTDALNRRHRPHGLPDTTSAMNRSTFLTAVTLSVGFASHSQAEPPVPVKTPNTVGVSSDEFDQSIAALRQELASVRAARQQARPVLEATQNADDVVSSVQQRRQLLDVLQRLAAAKPKTSSKTVTVPTTTTSPATAESPTPLSVDPPSPPTVDSFALGRASFQRGDYVQAERQFRLAVG